MSQDDVYLRHILDAIEKIATYTAVGRDRFIVESHWHDATMCGKRMQYPNTGTRARACQIGRMSDVAVFIRRARPSEGGDLTALALRSKAHWGYDAAFMQACVASLTITPEQIESSPFFLLESGDQVVGFYGLRSLGEEADLAYLFVEPASIGQGLGTRLWCHAVETAKALAFRRLLIESDPHAEPFYRAMGAQRIGEAPSDAIPGRMLPLLAYSLTE